MGKNYLQSIIFFICFHQVTRSCEFFEYHGILKPVMRTVDSVHRSEQEGGEEQRNGQTEHLDTVQTEVLHDVARQHATESSLETEN